jgi:microcystin degradation protein MlrC
MPDGWTGRCNAAHREIHAIFVQPLSFMPIASRVIEVDTPGLSNPDVLRLDFKHVRRPIYPLDVDMQWTPAAL